MNAKTIISALVLSAGFSFQAAAAERHPFQTEGDLYDELQTSAPSHAAPAPGPVAFQSEGDIHDELERVVTESPSLRDEPIRQAMADDLQPAFRVYP